MKPEKKEKMGEVKNIIEGHLYGVTRDFRDGKLNKEEAIEELDKYKGEAKMILLTYAGNDVAGQRTAQKLDEVYFGCRRCLYENRP